MATLLLVIRDWAAVHCASAHQVVAEVLQQKAHKGNCVRTTVANLSPKESPKSAQTVPEGQCEDFC